MTDEKRISPPPTRQIKDIHNEKFSDEWKRWFSLLLKFVNNLQQQIDTL